MLALLVTLLAVAAAVARGAWLVQHPHVDAPARVDAVVIIGPSVPERVRLAEERLRAGDARQLLVSAHPADTPGSTPAPCRTPVPGVEVTCFDPHPSTTQGEAQEIGRVARSRGWRQIEVVAFGPQIERARLIVGKCFDGGARFLDSGEPFDPQHQLVYQTGAFLKAWVTPGC